MFVHLANQVFEKLKTDVLALVIVVRHVQNLVGSLVFLSFFVWVLHCYFKKEIFYFFTH